MGGKAMSTMSIFLLALLAIGCTFTLAEVITEKGKPFQPTWNPAIGKGPRRANPRQVNVPPVFRTIVREHNQFRALHDAPALVWDSSIAAGAAASIADCNFAHDADDLQQRNVGENLYATSDPNRGAALNQATNAWYNEIAVYDFNNPGFTMETGHFTQVVWRSSTRIGCAARFCEVITGTRPPLLSGVIVSCRYSPPGNIEGQFEENVLPADGALPSPVLPSPGVSVSPVPGSPSPSPSPFPGFWNPEWLQGNYLNVRPNSLAVLAFRVRPNGVPVCPSARVIDRVEISGTPFTLPGGPGWFLNRRTAPSDWGFRGPNNQLVLGSETCEPRTAIIQYVFYTFQRPLRGRREGDDLPNGIRGVRPAQADGVAEAASAEPDTFGGKRPPVNGWYYYTYPMTVFLTDGTTHTVILRYYY